MNGDDDDGLPVLPYGQGDGASSGHSGSDTSEARATEADRSGETARRQRAVLAYLALRQERGATWQEVGRVLDLHHGQASGVLSNLHKAGRITRLTESRNRCKLYVLNECVDGRDVEPYGRAPDFVSERLDRDILAFLRDVAANDYPNGNEAAEFCFQAEALIPRIESRRGRG